ncbi:hypothetical protein PV350_04760 [Streptomyces sp. PA03-6a]|nr:hypothetical protein [Streptomyces sp. PA03-6a]
MTLPRVKNLRSPLVLTGGFTLISIGLGMRVGLWLGLVVAGVLAVVLDWHLAKGD